MRTLQVVVEGGEVFDVAVPDGYEIAANTSSRGLLSTPLGSFLLSEVSDVRLISESEVSASA